MCEYCSNSKSLFWENNTNNNAVREVYLELNGTMTVTTNLLDFSQENLKSELDVFPKAGCNFKINYCPMCGKKLEEE